MEMETAVGGGAFMLGTPLGKQRPSAGLLSPSAQATLNKHLPNFRRQQQAFVSPVVNKPVVQTADASSITDLCSCENLPEIEIFSLLEEQIPKYKVRSDYLSDFAGYANQDWFVPAPALHIPVDGLGLSKEQTRETLNYFLLCGNRVSQMTRAYDDIEAVTRLLEEKEKDLELTVQIGKELLTQNAHLEERIALLEAELKTSNDDRSQLLHELGKKSELIAVLTNDDGTGSEADTPTYSRSLTLELLQQKINTLQEQNQTLKVEASQLADQTDEVEEHERQLMADIGAQLNEANSQYDGLSLELERQREENRLQHEQIVSLTARLAEAEMRLHQLTQDNDEHVSLLNITRENQSSIALELVEFKQRYQEVLALLQEAQEQMRRQRKKTMPQARSGSFMAGNGSMMGGMSGLGMGGEYSLQSELMESSLYSENSMDSGISAGIGGGVGGVHDRIGRLMSQQPGGAAMGASSGMMNTSGMSLGAGGMSTQPHPYRRIFDTVRCASKNGNYTDSGCASMSVSQLGAMSMSTSSGPRMSSMIGGSSSGLGGFGGGAGGHGTMGVKTMSMESLVSQSDDDGYPSAPCGVPGAPGAKDLEAALKRLTPAEVLARRAMLSYAPAGTYSYDEPLLGHTSAMARAGGDRAAAAAAAALGVRTPDSIMSTGSLSGLISAAASSCSNSSMLSQWRLPDKLQIVKPIEGSQTLHHWSRLATPTLSGLLEERPGVTIRGGRDLAELGMQVYTLSDVEEDVSDDLPGKQFEASGCTYTFTTSHVMHPDDGIVNDLSFLSQSQMSSRMASASTSRNPSCPATPRAGLSRKNSCSTFSVNLGLASMLNERGIKAVTPSALNTPAGPNFTPTVTPCNSPEGSPTRCMSPEPLFGLLSSGADLIRRKLVGGDLERPNRQRQKERQQQQKIMLSRLERRALRSLKLVEKVESIGLENIITAAGASPANVAMSQLASGIANRSSSPMAQLTSLKHLQGAATSPSSSASSVASSSCSAASMKAMMEMNSNGYVDDLHFDRDQIKDVLHRGLKSPTAGVGVATPTATVAAAAAANKPRFGTTSSSSSAYNSDSDEMAAVKQRPTAETAAQQQPKSFVGSDAAATLPASAGQRSAPVPVADVRAKQLQRQKSRRHLKNGLNGGAPQQRPDLGTIAGGAPSNGGGGTRVRSDLGRVSPVKVEGQPAGPAGERPASASKTTAAHAVIGSDGGGGGGGGRVGNDEAAANASSQQTSLTQAFVGTVSSLLFGRKGGWL